LGGDLIVIPEKMTTIQKMDIQKGVGKDSPPHPLSVFMVIPENKMTMGGFQVRKPIPVPPPHN